MKRIIDKLEGIHDSHITAFLKKMRDENTKTKSENVSDLEHQSTSQSEENEKENSLPTQGDDKEN